MYIKDRILENLISKVIGLYPKSKTRYGIRLMGNKIQVFSYSKHKTKMGRQYAKLIKVKFGQSYS